MYEYIKGTLTAIYPTYLVIEAGGIGYQIHAANPFRFSAFLDQVVQLYLYQSVREDAITLYGFKDLTEKQLYLKLISVSGIGPKSGLSILASDNPAGLMQAIENEDIAYLTKFPGIGKKTASQIVLDLKGKLGELLPDDLPVQPLFEKADSRTLLLENAAEALAGLGYSEREIKKVMPQLKKEKFETTEEVLKLAFNYLLQS